MNGQSPEPPELKKIDAKKELDKAKIHLHNAKFQVQMLEADVKKLQELAR